MEQLIHFFGHLGGFMSLALGSVGSAIGIGLAGQAAAGAWSRESRAGKSLSFTYIILAGLPLSQTIYGFVAFTLASKAIANTGTNVVQDSMIAGAGLACGLAQLFSAWMQGAVCAAGIRALADGASKTFTNIIIAAGVVETVGIFGLAFTIGMIPK